MLLKAADVLIVDEQKGRHHSQPVLRDDFLQLCQRSPSYKFRIAFFQTSERTFRQRRWSQAHRLEISNSRKVV